MKAENLVGMKFGRLTVLELASRKGAPRAYRCKCDCGNETVVFATNLKRRNTTSCGCARTERIVSFNKKHGEKHTKLYGVWCGIRARCNNPNNSEYHRYGGRGIRCCDEWANFVAFRNWAFQNGYSDGLTIDRIDNDGDYSPQNCRWATHEEQSVNTSRNVYITKDGETHTMSDWAKLFGLNYKRLHRAIRQYGYTFDDAIKYAKK